MPYKNDRNIIQVMGKDVQKPLYIVNGKEVIDIEGLNPDEIETVNVLKGETAEKLYGSKGANVVVQITLKKKWSSDTNYKLNSHTLFPSSSV